MASRDATMNVALVKVPRLSRGLVIFARITAFDFQRLRRTRDLRTAPLLAASIFLDILNVVLLLTSLFGGREA
jgi:FtsH-binding integral membrane protein